MNSKIEKLKKMFEEVTVQKNASIPRALEDGAFERVKAPGFDDRKWG